MAAAVAALALGAGGTAQAATLLSGGWQSSCGPTTCFNDHGVYSITFSASSFNGPVDISRLVLDRAILGSMAGQFFNVSFTLGGQSLGTWGNWNMGGVGGDQFSLWGQDLTWNPADGDLVLVLQLVAPNGQKLDGSDGFGGGGGFFSYSNPPANPPPDEGDGGSVVVTLVGSNGAPVIDGSSDTGGGLPQDTAARGAPEPATWVLAIGGLGMAGAALRRRRGAAAAA